MGLCKSKPSIIASAAGDERAYQERFLESKTLGQGEFGIVKLVHDVTNKDLVGSKALAVKYLRKGYTFKDNTLYTPLKSKVLRGEVEILQRLNGECFNLKLEAVYESSSMIYMVTEYCEGGEIVPWVSKAFKNTSGLRTEDVSRICYQLWSAVDHCAKHNIIHRDIKPENVMFCTSEKDSQLRLIDFGSGTLDDHDDDPDPNVDHDHHTFAGSAFYISPEMFQKTYTFKTDVWSAGATLYVLVAGYPADQLQETFDVLQSSKAGRLRNLPNMPENMPDSFHEMLEGALAYRYKQRMSAGELMKGEFSQFHHVYHKEQSKGSKPGTISIHEIAAEAAGDFGDTVPEMGGISKSLTRTKSVILEGSVSRHNAYLGYKKFERSVTTVLATMLPKDISKKLLLLLSRHRRNSGLGAPSTEEKVDDSEQTKTNKKANADKLQVVTIKVLLEILGGTDVRTIERNDEIRVVDDSQVKEVISMIKALKGFIVYNTFAYHISLLRQFVSIHGRNNATDNDDDDAQISSVHGGNVWNSMKNIRGLGGGGHGGDKDSSTKSGGNFKGSGMRRISSATGKLSGMG